MHPAFSVIFFTTLSGTGYGVLAWTSLLVLHPYLLGHPPRQGVVPALWALLLALGLALTIAGLLSSLFHLGKPLRAWRAFSQWRTSWLSREGVAAMAATTATGALLALLGAALSGGPGYPALQGPAVPLLAAAVLLLACATVACTAMIYACLKPIPAWRHRLVVPVYLLFALLDGWLALVAVGSWSGLPARTLAMAAWGTWILAAATALAKRVYWRDIDRGALPADPGSAVGLPGRSVGAFERPHTEANYITREMGFVLARRHARPLRGIALLLFALVPALAAGLGWAVPAMAAPAFTLAAVSALAGAFLERWLFFAQARHAVTAYY